MLLKILGAILLLLGVFAIYVGIGYLLGDPLTAREDHCRSLCQALKAVTALLGETGGRVVTGIVDVVAGAGLCWLGVRFMTVRKWPPDY